MFISTPSQNQKRLGWLVGWLVVGWLVFMAYQPCNAKSIFIHKKKVLFQTIQFSISAVFVYAQLNVKTVLFQTIQFSISTVFISI